MNLALVGALWGREAVLRVARDLGIAWLYTPAMSTAEWQLLWRMENLRRVFFLNWSTVVPAWFVERVECVNFHCTALPYGRGGHPIENLIMRGHAETVITAHRMTREVDAGPVYATRGPISLAGSKDDILARFVEPAASLMREIVSLGLEPYPQAEDGVVRFARLSPEEYDQFWRERGGGHATADPRRQADTGRCLASAADPAGWRGTYFAEREVFCDRPKGHGGDHAAHDLEGKLLREWKDGEQ